MSQSRHLSRMIVMQTLYEWDFRPEKNIDEILLRNSREFEGQIDEKFAKKVITGVKDNHKTIDKLIISAAPDWPIDQVSRIDKVILEIAIFEMLFDVNEEIPPKVSINEAVELGKQFGSENTSKFVNGVLGTIYKNNAAKLEVRDKDAPQPFIINSSIWLPKKNRSSSLKN